MKYIFLLAVSWISFHAIAETTFFPSLDINQVHQKQLQQEKKGEAPEFAVAHDTNIRPDKWERENGKMVWRHTVYAPNAVSLNLGFTEFELPESATVQIHSEDHTQFMRELTSEDNNINHQFWTPVILADKIVIEVQVDEEDLAKLRLVIGHVGQGFREFGQSTQKAGSCNIDVACDDSKGWEKEVNSVAVIAIGGRSFCTGFMVNNAKEDKTPFFMTANHCRVSSSNAASLVAHWNYQKPYCRTGRGRYSDFQSGAVHLASWAKSDFTLVKLLSAPKDEWNVHYSGWSNQDVAPNGAVGIHHPNTDEKSISFHDKQTSITKYLSEDEGERTHVRISSWDKGTTEPGSSGSPLFDMNRRVVGQLHGGYASCSIRQADWYGRFHASWKGGGEEFNSLAPHLDPDKTGIEFVDTL